MDAEKGTEVEMKDLPPAQVQDDKDSEKDKLEETKGTENKLKEKKVKNEEQEAHVYCKPNSPGENIYVLSPKHGEGQEKEEKEKGGEQKDDKAGETDLYCKLKDPTENLYMSAGTSCTAKDKKEEEDEGDGANVYCKLNIPPENVYMSAGAQHNKAFYRRVCLYKWVSAVFIIATLVLLAVVICLMMKLSEVRSTQKCPASAEKQSADHNPPITKVVYDCVKCENHWLKLNNRCYFISENRLSWQESRKDCQKKGGDLAVIDNEDVQKVLTNKGTVLYWIGLHNSGQKWMWNNNTTLTHGYWATGQSTGSPDDCVLLKGQQPYLNNWYSLNCELTAQYICQKD